ncbi:MAG TPA: tetratricopeptide repeat protein [Planctomycetes bacterium]|nr:tetratricopeptide repeat protein [Planctomycetota bacterium]
MKLMHIPLAFVLAVAVTAEEPSYAVGATLYSRGLYADAADMFLAFAQNRPADALVPRALMLAGEARRRSGDTDAAYRIYEELSQKHPKSPQAALAQLRSLEIEITNNKTDGRAKILQSIRGLPQEAEALRVFLLAKTLVAEGRRDEAMRVIEQAEGAGLAGGGAYLIKGDVALDAGDHSAALAAYQKALQEERLKPAATLRLAELARRAGRTSDALGLYRSVNAASFASEREKAVWAAGYALALLASGEYVTARQQISAALLSARNVPEDLRNTLSAALAPAMGVSVLLAGDDKALQELLPQLPPDDRLTLWLRVWAAYRSGNHRAALSAAQAAQAMLGDADPAILTDVRLLGALSAAALNDWQAMKPFMSVPFTGYPDYIQAHLHVMRLAAEKASAAEINSALEALLKTSPPAPVAAWAEALLAYHALLAGEIENAEMRIKAFTAANPASPYVVPLKKSLLAAASTSAEPGKIIALAGDFLPFVPPADAPAVNELLAWGMYRQGRKKEAADALLKARAASRDNTLKPRMLYEAALCTAESGDEAAAVKLLRQAHDEGHPLPADTAVWLVLRLPPEEAPAIAERLAPALGSPGAQGAAAMLAVAQVHASARRWQELGQAMDVYLAARAPGDAPPDVAVARMYKALADLNLDRTGAAFAVIDSALPLLDGFRRMQGLVVRGRALARLGRLDEALADLLHVGILAAPADTESISLVREALLEARSVAEKLGKNALLPVIDKSLADIAAVKAP